MTWGDAEYRWGFKRVKPRKKGYEKIYQDDMDRRTDLIETFIKGMGLAAAVGWILFLIGLCSLR